MSLDITQCHERTVPRMSQCLLLRRAAANNLKPGLSSSIWTQLQDFLAVRGSLAGRHPAYGTIKTVGTQRGCGRRRDPNSLGACASERTDHQGEKSPADSLTLIGGNNCETYDLS